MFLKGIQKTLIIKESDSHSVVSYSLGCYGLQPTRLLCPWNSPGQNTGLGSHPLLQEIFLTQGSNPGHLHCRWILHHLSRQGSSIIKENIINWILLKLGVFVVELPRVNNNRAKCCGDIKDYFQVSGISRIEGSLTEMGTLQNC